MTALFNRYELKDETELMNKIADKMLQLPWFKNIGNFNQETETKLVELLDELHVDQYKIQWIAKDMLTEKLNAISFGDSAVWKALKDLPTTYIEKIEQKEMEEAWNILLQDFQEHLFHVVFDKAYEQYQEEEELRYLIYNAHYVSIIITLAELAGDTDFADKLTQVQATGNVVVGFQGENLYLL